jgi:solute carrier family 45 protein 1/2/4
MIQVSLIQGSAAMSWFPVFFYSTIYIGDLYKQSSPAPTTDKEQTFIDTEAMRIGSRALFYSAVLTFIINLVLPVFIVKSARYSAVVGDNSWGICRVPRWMQIRLVTIWAVSHFVFAACMFATL